MNNPFSLRARVERLAAHFEALFDKVFEIDHEELIDLGTRMAPAVRNAGKPLNLDFSIPDRFTAATKASATVFAKTGDDFLRITTSVKSQNGTRAIGTLLDRSHPAYRNLNQGHSYTGYATIFGKQYMTHYAPVRDAAGRVVGALYVGLDVEGMFSLSVAWRLAALLGSVSAVVFLLALKLGAGMASTWPAQIGISIVAALPVGLLACLLVHREVSLPLQHARAAAQRMADGDLTAQVAVDRRDDIGQLLLSINSISVGLAAVVGNVRSASEAIRAGLGQFSEDNRNLASHAERQAGELGGMVTAVKNTSTLVERNEASAHQASGMVVSSAALAEQGGAVVQQVVDNMDSIRDSARQIADIVSMIDGIAFQTNILALNAAVEAARAGESGRGFAVVATEVRALAQRSAAAAKEIAHLIGHSVETTDAGGKLAQQAGDGMRKVVASIEQVVGTVKDIDLAGREQRQRMTEVTGAVEEIERMSEESMEIVRRSVASTAHMQEQVMNLVRAVEAFKIAS